MQIDTLKVYCDVVRLRSFSRGAEANNVLQATASLTVQRLEKHLGVNLIDRSCRPWRRQIFGQRTLIPPADLFQRLASHNQI